MNILSIVGARPNFMKVAPLHRAFTAHSGITSKILHTGQHYDAKMSDVFFNQLGMPEPDFHLGVGGGSHTWQTAHVMLKFEEILTEERPDVVLVVGDVNATVACSLVAVKMGLPTVHVEAGLRSGDRTMPEELNRLVTDVISDHLFVTEHSGLVNLAKEGVSDNKVSYVGNVMIDSLVHFRDQAADESILDDLGVLPKEYILMTMHRPHNVDDEKGLRDIIQIIRDATRHKQVVFPIHPRTANNFRQFSLTKELNSIPGLILTDPQGYLQFLKLMDNAAVIVTDSGGIQEETTFLQVPCITFRDTTERPVTVELGTNFLMADLNPVTVRTQLEDILSGNAKVGTIPALWDGHAADRIAKRLWMLYGQ
ncbi:non-hydrolyzing UDP-N-acetylglucosamine 2-epimerase [Lewinella sp. JB7]|uniref:non-hydrolyzing UDP-N-acetylglucosamine 2-epimerase n=1 Tax=Lewinella sp. JB7 TaxID=2962887 RepID=UPI0020C9A863|nr:UDP-N-acetylglucosamine 2-epimerase (non-hydrolyzing) [Lewinella sp. JB7]MCP9236772.1 UDP-N-acetylglucosamine 2-epimerase (non-hydrolyzing) [Lewinella sp. JB7]